MEKEIAIILMMAISLLITKNFPSLLLILIIKQMKKLSRTSINLYSLLPSIYMGCMPVKINKKVHQ